MHPAYHYNIAQNKKYNDHDVIYGRFKFSYKGDIIPINIKKLVIPNEESTGVKEHEFSFCQEALRQLEFYLGIPVELDKKEGRRQKIGSVWTIPLCRRPARRRLELVVDDLYDNVVQTWGRGRPKLTPNKIKREK